MLQGETVSTVHLILDGWVKGVRTMPSGREVLVAVLGPDEIIGHFEAFEGGGARHWATVITLDELRTTAVHADRFLEFLREHPDAALEQLRRLIEQVARTDRRLREAALFDTAHRLASLLVDLADRQSEATPDGVMIGIPLSQDEISSLIGASRDSVARALTSLRKRGLVRTGRRTMTIVDLDAVRAFADEML